MTMRLASFQPQTKEVAMTIRLRHGHAPGHFRQTFSDAVEAFDHWKPGEPEPMVDFEVNWEPRSIPISKACDLVWNCTDILPGIYYQILQDLQEPPKLCTYPAAARALKREIEAR
jgi:hypothetical protein